MCELECQKASEDERWCQKYSISRSVKELDMCESKEYTFYSIHENENKT